VDEGARLDAIRRRGALRVGYLPNSLPFAFFNQRDDLVGFDVELAHRLAGELQVGLEFVPVDRQVLDAQLAAGVCDLVMSGVAVTTDAASRTLFSSSYLDETVGLLVRDADRARFATWDAVRAAGAIRLSIPNVPYYIARLRELAPDAALQPFTDLEAELQASPPPFDALALPAERGSAWTLIYPQYSVVVPGPGTIRVPLAYPLARRDEEFASFINTWIELKRKDGTIDALYQYWILGRNAEPPKPRWSIMRNVLYWVD
ncbi:MAG TPA: transporter substrate-binding domain-containing protein, partial [Vicinamibacterales bacterium]|nr:transporter substrate-binding domain-containing protein [Vicinamibacterales bacterium]